MAHSRGAEVRRKRGDAGLSTDDLVRRYRAGETCRAIAAATGPTQSAVRYRLTIRCG